jgi:hypothetical protein
MKAHFSRWPDIHRGPEPDSFQAFEHLDTGGIIDFGAVHFVWHSGWFVLLFQILIGMTT